MKRTFLVFFFFLLFSIISFVFFSRSNAVKFNTITVKGEFSISVPEYLSKASIDPSALLQYKNEEEQMFVLVYKKTDSTHIPLSTFFKSSADALIQRIGQAELLKYYPTLINSDSAMIGNIRGTVNETRVYYRMAVIAAGNSYYKILIGISDSNRSKYEEEIAAIIAGFTILPS